MRSMLIAGLVAAGIATPAFAATGIAPDPSTWVMLAAGFAMVGLAASGRNRSMGRTAD